MCARNDRSYANFLLGIGNGDKPYVQDDMTKLSNDIVTNWINSNSVHSLINSVFPNLAIRLYDIEYITNKAILAPNK